MDVQTRIRDVLSSSVLDESRGGRPHPPNQGFGEQELVQVLRDQGIIEDVMSQLQFSGASGMQPAPQSRVAPKHSRPATHFADKQDRVVGVPLKKGNTTTMTTVQKCYPFFSEILWRSPWAPRLGRWSCIESHMGHYLGWVFSPYVLRDCLGFPWNNSLGFSSHI